MPVPEAAASPPQTASEHFDVLIVGAGISGVGAAYHLLHQRPGTSFAATQEISRYFAEPGGV
jgi:cation diffusion facilitator CzcD-associated flavoprotein CzcO